MWRVDLDDARWDGWEWVLDSEERRKAARFRTTQLQQRARRCRAALRCILAPCCPTPPMQTGSPASLVLLAGRYGKPALAGDALHFNVSHSERWALVAVSCAPVGVDIEPALRPDIVVADIAALACHPLEVARLQGLEDQGDAAIGALMRLWTQKEAYVKALGTGLLHALPSVRLMSDPGDAGALVIDESAPAGERYYVHQLHAPPLFVAALCTPLKAPVMAQRHALP